MEDIKSKMDNERSFFDSLGNSYPMNSETDVDADKIGGISCYRFTPQKITGKTILIYLHGGAYSLGSFASHRSLVSHITARLESKTIFVEYSLAPEKPFPHGVQDVLKVYEEARRRYPKHKIVFFGDSAGGGLAISCISYLDKAGLKLPDGLILLSPWIDLDCKNNSYETRQELDPILSRQLLQSYASYYMTEDRISNNPALLNFDHFPPALIMVGSNEVLHDDAWLFQQKIKTAQENIVFKEYAGQTHVWLLTNISSEGSEKALNDMSIFVKSLDLM